MNQLVLNNQILEIKDRTRLMTAISVVLHILLIFSLPYIYESREFVRAAADFTEFTFVSRPLSGKSETTVQDIASGGTNEKKPIEIDRLDKRFTEKLVLMRSEKRAYEKPVGSQGMVLQISKARMKGFSAAEVAEVPTELRRNKQEGFSQMSLPRAGHLPIIEPADNIKRQKPAEEISMNPESGIPGMTLTGPASDRKIVSSLLPEYPRWALRDAVEATVKLHFVVLPNGNIKENILIKETSGYEEFDRNAAASILSWRFSALPAGGNEEQWGDVVFKYRLGNKEKGEKL
ncbi:energy transducer TonB [bacterium]|nr:energy transducer TonB [bacterium]